MPDFTQLEAMSIDEFRAELAARQARSDKTLGVPPAESLEEFDEAAIVEVLNARQKVIYGVDDRVDIFTLTDPAAVADADSVVALFRANDITDNGNGTSTLVTQNFGAANNLCAAEPFRDQPVGAFCSGFLVDQDVIATAGHCVNASNVTTVRFVFGFRMQNQTTAQTVIANAQIYRGVAVIGREQVSNGADWALVRVDRQVADHPVVDVRREGRIPDSEPVHVIGHPNGLPTKFAGGASVRNNNPAGFFVANLDTYGGNSGSPVFNANTHEVEGILVRGENDFVQQGTCQVSLICPNTGCRGEDCTRTTEFDHLLAPATVSVVRGGPAVFGRDLAANKKSIYVITNDGRLAQVWDTDQWNLDFPAELGGQQNLRFQAGPAVFGRDAGANKKSIYVITNDGRLAQVWDTDQWNLDFPAELGGQQNLRFQAGPAVFGRDAGANKKSIYVITNDGRLAQVWDTDQWNLDFPAELGGQQNLRFQAGPAVFGRDAGANKKSIYVITNDGRLAQVWDTDQWNLDFPAELGGQQNLRFQAGPAVFGRDAGANKKSIYVITNDGRLAQVWDTDQWNLDFPAELAGQPGLRFQGSPAVFGRDLAANKKSIYLITTDGRLAQVWDTDQWNLDFP